MNNDNEDKDLLDDHDDEFTEGVDDETAAAVLSALLCDAAVEVETYVTFPSPSCSPCLPPSALDGPVDDFGKNLKKNWVR